jgi:hypothetical protein
MQHFRCSTKFGMLSRRLATKTQSLGDAFYRLTTGTYKSGKLASVAANEQNTFLQRLGRFLFFVVLAAVAAPFW